MKEYHLLKYRKPSDKRKCPSCGDKSFKPYVDDDGNILDNACGRCDHQNSCGYHLPPSEWFKLNPDERRSIAEGHTARQDQKDPPTMLTLDKSIVKQCHSDRNNFITFLRTWVAISPLQVQLAYEKYLIGSTREGHIIWWQIDEQQRVRTGKVMYYKEDGHRLKQDEYQARWLKHGNKLSIGPTNWIHTIMEKQGKINREKDNTELRQCLFGLHLLNLPGNENTPVAIVESEKSAFICSMFAPQYLWMATGGLYNINTQILEPVIKQNRKIVFFPDLDGYKKTTPDGKYKKNWIDEVDKLNYPNAVVSTFVREHAWIVGTDTCDIADIALHRVMVGRELEPDEVAMGLKEPHAGLRELKTKFDTKWIK